MCVEIQNANRGSECSREGAKQQKLKGQMTHTLAAQNSLTFISYYYDVQKGFVLSLTKRFAGHQTIVLVWFLLVRFTISNWMMNHLLLLLSEIKEKKHIELNNVHWYPCMSWKNWTMSTGGRVQSKKTSGTGSPVGWQHKSVDSMLGLVVSPRHSSQMLPIVGKYQASYSKHHHQPELMPKLMMIVVICRYYVMWDY